MELLIRVVDKQPIVSALYEVSSQKGDVITIQQDGWPWSAAERANPDWIIVQSPITDQDAADLLEGPREGEPNFRRRVGLNVDDLKSGDVLTRNALMARIV